jgi:hypothetical protein
VCWVFGALRVLLAFVPPSAIIIVRYPIILGVAMVALALTGASISTPS